MERPDLLKVILNLHPYTFKGTAYLATDKGIEELRKVLNGTHIMEGFTASTNGRTATRSGRVIIVIRIGNDPAKVIQCIAHECFHLTDAVFSSIGAENMNCGEGEPAAYLHGSFVRQLVAPYLRKWCDIGNKNKSRNGNDLASTV